MIEIDLNVPVQTVDGVKTSVAKIIQHHNRNGWRKYGIGYSNYTPDGSLHVALLGSTGEDSGATCSVRENTPAFWFELGNALRNWADLPDDPEVEGDSSLMEVIVNHFSCGQMNFSMSNG